MAKRKDSVALFEVITAAKKKEAARAAAVSDSVAASKPITPSVLRTPKWWFKGKHKALGNAVDPGLYGNPALPAPAARDPLQLSIAAAVDATAAASAPAPGVVQRVTPASYTASPERVTIPAAAVAVTGAGAGAAAEHVGITVDPFGLDLPAPTEPAYGAKPRRSLLGFGVKKVNLDADRREVTVRFRYTTAIVVGFALCVAVGLAYVTGRQSSNRAKGNATGVSSDQVRRGPILAGVLDVSPADRSLSTNGPAIQPKDLVPARPQQPKATPPTNPTGQPPRTAIDPRLPGEANGVDTRLPRSVGLNYVVVQSYPDRKSAEEAQKALEEAGIPCTVEQGLRDFAASNFYSVVGTHGFSAIKSSAAYKQYEESIRAVSKSYAGTSKYKKFDPSPYKWKPQ